MLRRGAWALAALALAVAAPAAAQGTAGMLTIDDDSPVRVTSAAAVRRAMRGCGRSVGCIRVMLETCDRCILSAEGDEGGYVIRSRLGPPGPDYDLVGQRTARGRYGIYVFTAAELVEIFAGYISGRQPGYVRAVEVADERW